MSTVRPETLTESYCGRRINASRQAIAWPASFLDLLIHRTSQPEIYISYAYGTKNIYILTFRGSAIWNQGRSPWKRRGMILSRIFRVAAQRVDASLCPWRAQLPWCLRLTQSATMIVIGAIVLVNSRLQSLSSLQDIVARVVVYKQPSKWLAS